MTNSSKRPEPGSIVKFQMGGMTVEATVLTVRPMAGVKVLRVRVRQDEDRWWQPTSDFECDVREDRLLTEEEMIWIDVNK